MKIKVTKHKLNIHYRGSPWGSRTQQHAYCLRYAHFQHTESHLSKKQPQAKIPIVFLFSQLHFNNVTSHALYYSGHLIMRSKRCAVQNQGITLRSIFPEKYIVKDRISNTKLEKGYHYYIQTRHKDLFSHYNLILKSLRKNVPKSARKYKRNVLMPPGHPIVLLKSK